VASDSFFEAPEDPDLPEGPGYGWLPVAAMSGAVLVVLGIILLWPRSGDVPDPAGLGLAQTAVRAEVTTVEPGPCPGTRRADDIECTLVGFRLLEGRDSDETVVLGFGEAESTPEFAEGDRVVLYDQGGNARMDRRYQYADRERRPVLLFVTLAFALAVVALGRWRGLASLAGLAISVVVLTVFIIPSILSGRPATLVAVVGAAAIAYSALYLAHGLNPLTHVAVLGTLGALALTVALSALVTALAELSGFASEEALLVSQLGATVDVSGLILAGIVLGAVGALDDVTVTQTSTVWELRLANPGLNGGPLLRAGLRVGRDHVVSSVNTLLLAYAGAAIPLLILFSLSDLGLGTVANSEIVATEIIRTLVGSIGLVAAVPITTWLASEVASSLPHAALRRH
jgi:uncharacterized membrane protein